MSDKPDCPGSCTAKVAVLQSETRNLQEAILDISTKLDKILEQTTKTNGRVTVLELRTESSRDSLARNFKNDEDLDERVKVLESNTLRLTGIITGVSLTASVVGALLGYILK